jgi:SAM-dependent methyltransferase
VNDARGAMRRTMFLSQDGVMLATTLRGLDRLGVLTPSLHAERSLAELCPDLTEAGFGAQRVALHGLAAAGWLDGPPELEAEKAFLRWTAAGREAMRHRHRYVAVGDFLAGFDSNAEDAWTLPWSADQVEWFATLVAAREVDDAEIAGLTAAHLDGGLAVPALLWLHETGRLEEDGPKLPGEPLGAAIGRFLRHLGWVDDGGGWTGEGRQARAFGLNFGGVATYLPLLARLPELYRGELTVVPDPTAQEPEWHVQRALNVRISATAHRRYFADSEALFVEIFNRQPLAEQPRFIADMGCGEGSWLVHLHRLVAERTRRGKALGELPLTMVGIDPDQGALELARRNLEAAGVPALLIRGDVTDPDRLATDLAGQGLAIEDGLHIRSFIDHERSYRGGDPRLEAPGWSSGVYMDAGGAPLSGPEVERDFIAHLGRWARHTPKHGLVVLEAHCTSPDVVARNLGSLHGIAFDAHQAYSKQYPVDHPAFVECCRLAGLRSLPRRELRYPTDRPFVAVSLHRLLPSTADPPLPGTAAGTPRADSWQPEPGVDLEDGEALHRILFRDGDIRYPASWGSAATGFVVTNTLAAIRTRLEGVDRGGTIRVLDYGAGTGTATIELLKACRDSGLEYEIDQRQVSLEIHLVDLPSPWYAKGYELLRECSWTRFHSLREPGSGFRPLARVLRDIPIDAAMANMVFHLVPKRALERSMRGLAEVLVPDGRLLWSAPDLGPASPGSVLLHDPNRALRERWLELHGDELEAEARRVAQERADRRIQPRPLAADVAAALAAEFDGEIETVSCEMLAEDIVAGLLVPSNQAEFLPEIPDREGREASIRELMLGEVLPRMRAGEAGTSLGLNLHWTLGSFTRRP